MKPYSRKARDPFHHPGPDEVDFEELLVSLHDCRCKVNRLWAACGLRNPLAREAEALMAQIDAVAVLTRVPGAQAYVSPVNVGHSAPSKDTNNRDRCGPKRFR